MAATSEREEAILALIRRGLQDPDNYVRLAAGAASKDNDNIQYTELEPLFSIPDKDFKRTTPLLQSSVFSTEAFHNLVEAFEGKDIPKEVLHDWVFLGDNKHCLAAIYAMRAMPADEYIDTILMGIIETYYSGGEKSIGYQASRALECRPLSMDNVNTLLSKVKLTDPYNHKTTYTDSTILRILSAAATKKTVPVDFLPKLGNISVKEAARAAAKRDDIPEETIREWFTKGMKFKRMAAAACRARSVPPEVLRNALEDAKDKMLLEELFRACEAQVYDPEVMAEWLRSPSANVRRGAVHACYYHTFNEYEAALTEIIDTALADVAEEVRLDASLCPRDNIFFCPSDDVLEKWVRSEPKSSDSMRYEALSEVCDKGIIPFHVIEKWLLEDADGLTTMEKRNRTNQGKRALKAHISLNHIIPGDFVERLSTSKKPSCKEFADNINNWDFEVIHNFSRYTMNVADRAYNGKLLPEPGISFADRDGFWLTHIKENEGERALCGVKLPLSPSENVPSFRRPPAVGFIKWALQSGDYETMLKGIVHCRGREDIPVEVFAGFMDSDDPLVRCAVMLACGTRDGDSFH